MCCLSHCGALLWRITLQPLCSVLNCQRQYTACHDAPAVGVLKQWLAGGSRNKSSTAAGTTAAIDDAATAGTGDSADSDSDTTATDELQQDELDVEDEVQVEAADVAYNVAETELETEPLTEPDSEPDAIQYDDDNDTVAVVLREADSRMIDAFVAKLDNNSEGVAIDALLDAAEAEQPRGVRAMNNCSIFKKEPTANTAASATGASSGATSTAAAVTPATTDTVMDSTVLFSGALATAEDAVCSGMLHSVDTARGSDTVEVCIDADTNGNSTVAEAGTTDSTTKTTSALSTYIVHTSAAATTDNSRNDNVAVAAKHTTDDSGAVDEPVTVSSKLIGSTPGDTMENVSGAHSDTVIFSTTTALSNYVNTMPVVATQAITTASGCFTTRTTATQISEKLVADQGATLSTVAVDSTAYTSMRLGTTTALSTYVMADTTIAAAAMLTDTTTLTPAVAINASPMITATTVHEHSMAITTDDHASGGSDTENTTATAATASSATAASTDSATTVLSKAAYDEACETACSIETFTCDTPVMMHYTMYPEPARSKQVNVNITAAATATTDRSDGTQTSGNSDSSTAATASATGTTAAAGSSDTTVSGSSANNAAVLVAAMANASSTTATSDTAATNAAATAVSDTVEDSKADETLFNSDDDMSIDDNESDTPADPEPLTAVELHQQQLAITESTNNSGTVTVSTAAGTTVPTVKLLYRSMRDAHVSAAVTHQGGQRSYAAVTETATTATTAATAAASAAADATAHDDDAMSECRSVADDTVDSSSGTSHPHKQKRKRDSETTVQVQEEERSAKGLWVKGAKKRPKHVQKYEVDADAEVTAVLQKCQLNPSQLKVVKRFMDDAYSNDPALHLVQGKHTHTHLLEYTCVAYSIAFCLHAACHTLHCRVTLATDYSAHFTVLVMVTNAALSCRPLSLQAMQCRHVAQAVLICPYTLLYITLVLTQLTQPTVYCCITTHYIYMLHAIYVYYTGPPGSGKTTSIVSLLCALAVKKDTR
jgi:hypothetical protein